MMSKRVTFILDSNLDNKIRHIQVKMMSERVTIILDSDLNKKIRYIQAKMIKESNASVSFSKVLSQVLIKGLKE